MGVLGVTVSYNSGPDLDFLLKSVTGQVDRLIVVDNASHEDVAPLVAKYDFVTLIKNSTNVGFARAVNRALGDAAGDDVVLLNPDVTCPPGSVAELAAVSRDLDDRYIVAPRLVYPDGRIQENVRTCPTPVRLLARRSSFGRTGWGAQILRRHLAQTESGRAVPTDWAIGAVLYVPSTVLAALGAMDERFFLYCEDLDWCVRAWRHGSGVMYAPGVEMMHRYQRSSRATWDVRNPTTRLHWASLAKFFAKHPAVMFTGRVQPRITADSQRLSRR